WRRARLMDCLRPADGSGPTPPMSWERCGYSRGWSAWLRHCVRRPSALAKEAPAWLQERVPPDWYERYGRRIEEYRLPRSQADREAYARQVGADGGWLLAQLAQSQTPAALNCLAEVGLLQQFWQQEYVLNAVGGYELRDPKAVPAASDHLESPDEPQARFATKRGRHWTGYKVHLTETCDE